MNFIQQTVVLVKPDALQRGLVGEIVSRFERKGLKLVGIKMISLTDKIVEEWYAHHKNKSFFADIKKFMTWTPVVAMIWEGVKCIDVVRKLMGSIRGDLSMSGSQNLIHASDSKDSAEKEIGLIFKPHEIFAYKSVSECLIYSEEDFKENL